MDPSPSEIKEELHDNRNQKDNRKDKFIHSAQVNKCKTTVPCENFIEYKDQVLSRNIIIDDNRVDEVKQEDESGDGTKDMECFNEEFEAGRNDPSGIMMQDASIVAADYTRYTYMEKFIEEEDDNYDIARKCNDVPQEPIVRETSESTYHKERLVLPAVNQHQTNTFIPMISVEALDKPQKKKKKLNHEKHPDQIDEKPMKKSSLSLIDKCKEKIQISILVVIVLVTAAAIVAGVCGSGKCSSKEESGIIDTFISNTLSPSPSPSPSTTFRPTPTMAPTGPYKAFATTEELYLAVDEYQAIMGTPDAMNSTVALTYGYPINTWDVHHITDFSRLFDPQRHLDFFELQTPGISSFNEDLSGWDMSSATSLFAMFNYATAFEGIGLSEWNVGNVRNMSWIFSDAKSFSADISSWNTASVTTMQGAFWKAKVFDGNLSTWSTGNVEDLTETFFKAEQFTGIGLEYWDVHSVTSLRRTFAEADSFNADIADWNVSSCMNMAGTFFYSSSFGANLSSWDTR